MQNDNETPCILVECHKDSKVTLSVHKTDVTNTSVQLPENDYVKAEGEWIYFKAEIGGVEHGAVARIVKGKKN